MTFEFTILGSGSALPTLKRSSSAHVLNAHEQFYLIDAGEGVQLQLGRYGINPLKIDNIFISHCHGDHVYGLFGLLSSYSLLGRKRQLNIYGPKPIEEILKFHTEYFDAKRTYDIKCYPLDDKESRVIFENKVLTVTTIPLKHKIATVGFLFAEKVPALNIKKYCIEKYSLSLANIASAKRGDDVVLDDGSIIENSELTYRPYEPRSLAYCSDTALSRTVIDAVRGASILYHEATFLGTDKKLAMMTGHSTTIDAATVAREASVGKLIIGHLSARYKNEEHCFLEEVKSVFENSYLAKDGDKFNVTLSK